MLLILALPIKLMKECLIKDNNILLKSLQIWLKIVSSNQQTSPKSNRAIIF
jgi:hypothetical protein